jgi:hypothetical protein
VIPRVALPFLCFTSRREGISDVKRRERLLSTFCRSFLRVGTARRDATWTFMSSCLHPMCGVTT